MKDEKKEGTVEARIMPLKLPPELNFSAEPAPWASNINNFNLRDLSTSMYHSPIEHSCGHNHSVSIFRTFAQHQSLHVFNIHGRTIFFLGGSWFRNDVDG
jgi:hypothetical protein